MVFKEKKLAILIFLLRYGRMTAEEARSLLNLSRTSLNKDFEKLCQIPGVYSNIDNSIIFSFYYIISHRIPEFYDCNHRKIFLKDIKTKSPPSGNPINYSSNDTLREYFA